MTEEERKEIFEKYPPYVPKRSSSNFVDISGMDFPGFKVLYRIKDLRKWKTSYLCECKCENQTLFPVTKNNIITGNTNSCGCYNIQRIIESSKKYNTYDLSGDYGIGYTFKGEEFYFDLEDYEKIKNHCWYINKRKDVESRINGKLVKMHRFIMNVTDPKIEVDHIYHNENGEGRRYDNRKSNLRLTTHLNNMKNVKKRNTNKSGITGVNWNKRRNKWEARITVNGKEIHLGFKDKKEDAAQLRKNAEEKYFGEFQYKEYEGDLKYDQGTEN